MGRLLSWTVYGLDTGRNGGADGSPATARRILGHAADERTREQIARLRASKHAKLRRIPDLLVELVDLDLKEEALARALGMTARDLRRLRAELRR